MVIGIFGESCVGRSALAERLETRLGGHLPAPVAGMLERKHGTFDSEPHHVHIMSGETGLDAACGQVLRSIPA